MNIGGNGWKDLAADLALEPAFLNEIADAKGAPEFRVEIDSDLN